jgi:hypothetical protein
MAKNQKMRPTNISRRSVLQGVAFAVGATPIILATTYPASAAKMSQASAGYRNSPKGGQNCANCKLFVPPSSCTLVEGPISAHGWCRLWVSK